MCGDSVLGILGTEVINLLSIAFGSIIVGGLFEAMVRSVPRNLMEIGAPKAT